MPGTKCPAKSQLVSCSIDAFEKYIKYLLGPRVRVLVTVDESDKPVSAPKLNHVLIYDLAIRKKVAVLLNEGHDIRTAFKLACKDTETRQVHFLANVSIEIGTSECKACTALGLKESFLSAQVNLKWAQSERGIKRPAAEMGESKEEAELKAQLKAAQ